VIPEHHALCAPMHEKQFPHFLKQFPLRTKQFPRNAATNHLPRPGLTDCGALGKIILGGPQIKVKTKKKKKRSQPLPAAIPHQSTIFLP